MEPHLEELVKSALLGTDKYLPEYTLFGEDLVQKINTSGTDREDIFLRQCAAAFAHEAAGSTTVQLVGERMVFPHTTLPTVSGGLGQLLETAIREENRPTLAFLAHTAHQKGVCAQPHLVPDLLDLALKHGDPQGHLKSVSGAVGQWLSQFNPRWAPLFNDQETTDDFETAAHAVRLILLRQLRQTDPAAAVAQLERVIHQEPADARWELLMELREGLGVHDMAFLEKMLKDKSKKVRDLVVRHLCCLPTSEIAQQYGAFLKSALEITEKRGLFTNKKQITFVASATPDPLLFQLGLEKISSAKGVEDHIYQIAQAVAQMPPDLLAQTLQTDPDTLLDLLQQSKSGDYLMPYLEKAAEAFSHPGWSKRLLEQTSNSLIMLACLSEEDQLSIGQKWMEKGYAGVWFGYLLNQPHYKLLPNTFASKVIDFVRYAPYYIENQHYIKLGFRMPDSAAPQIEKILKAGVKADDHSQQQSHQHLEQVLRGIQIRQQVQD